ncbi:MAG: 1-acyl-sn-glycerol-3-phosphate acyltransferase [Flavobacteriales bacterium]|nr:1-acyl-sn-glycerol-3-phosphate acyltransferase [Flavobacteriales bacterium]
MLYGILKSLFRIALRNYFREIRVFKPFGIPTKEPLIVLPNHTSAFLDPIVVAAYTPRPYYFLARGESFENPVISAIYRAVHMIPIYRPEHTPDKVQENEAIFSRCYDLLERNGCLMIFPEGVCQMEARLMPLKTGAARIALGAAARSDFRLNISLLPLGINYTNSHTLQGKLFMNFGTPINTAGYRDLYMEDPVEAARQLTAQIERDLSDLIVTVEEERDLELAKRVEEILHSEPDLPIEKKESAADWYLSRKQIVDSIGKIRRGEADVDIRSVENRIDAFFRKADSLSFRRKLLHPLGKHRGGDVSGWLLFVYFFFAAPLFLLGFAAHALPLKLTAILADLIVKRDDFRGSVLLVLGVLIFLVFLGLELWVLSMLGLPIWLILLYIPIFPVVGLVAFRYWIRLRRLLDIRHVWKNGRKGRERFRELQAERRALIDLFQRIHVRLSPTEPT